jgi:hypothetical protein
MKKLIIFKGRKKGIVRTMDIEIDDIRAVFFPRTFFEKYRYLGYIPFSEERSMIHALVIAMDDEAKPWWCPRWFLRFLHLFGSDNSIVRVRNRRMHNLGKRLTKGIMMLDYKTKWSDYDLRISISAPDHLQDLADAIERYTYDQGRREDLIGRIKRRNPSFTGGHLLNSELEKILKNLESEID